MISRSSQLMKFSGQLQANLLTLKKTTKKNLKKRTAIEILRNCHGTSTDRQLLNSPQQPVHTFVIFFRSTSGVRCVISIPLLNSMVQYSNIHVLQDQVIVPLALNASLDSV